MGTYVSLMVIALAISLDGCSVGLLYGARRIRIPLISLTIMSICSGLMIWCSMKLGVWFSGYIDEAMARVAGAIILVAVGIWAIVQFFWRPPSADGDRDQSGDISALEASLLGISLSLDALGAGIGAALVGYAALQTALLIAISSGLFIAIGLKVGRWAGSMRFMRKMTVLPGFLLVALGILKLL